MGNQLARSVLSFIVSLAVWAFLYNNLMAAAILMVVILIHEMGHYVAGLMLGTKVKLPVFAIIGAFVEYEAPPKGMRDRFIISLAGPLLGGLAAAGMYVAGIYLQSKILLVAASFGLILNAFQLIPVPMLDGGHAALAIDRRLWKVGIGMIIVFAAAQLWLKQNFMPLLFIVLFWEQVRNYMEAVEREFEERPETFAATPGQRTVFAFAYFGLCAAFMAACYFLGINLFL